MITSLMNAIATPILAEGGFWTKLFFRQAGQSDHGRHVDFLFLAIWWISIVAFVIVMVAMLWFVLKYRRKPGVAAERSPSHHTALELTWSIVPLIFMAWMFFEGFWGYTDAVVAPANSEQLMVTAKKWNWSIQYPNGASSPWVSKRRNDEKPQAGSPPMAIDDKVKPNTKTGAVEFPVFVAPAGRPTMFRMISEDVLHSFWIPDFRIKFDVFPNRYTAVWINPTNFKGMFVDDKGRRFDEHWIACAEYCGDQHAEMGAILRVMSEADYQSVLDEWSKPTGTPEQKGGQLYRMKGCNACHSVDGSKNVGPTWKGVFGSTREFTNGTSTTADENYIRESILDPAKNIVKTFPNQMITYQGRISEEEISFIIAYMRSIGSNPGPATGTPAAGDPAAPTPGPAPAQPDASGHK